MPDRFAVWGSIEEEDEAPFNESKSTNGRHHRNDLLKKQKNDLLN
jgi:hypothetical protein